MAKFKCEVMRCAEKKLNRKATAVFGLMKATFDCGGNTRQHAAGVKCHEGNSVDSRKDDFLKLMM
jgi:hypothetical protein